VINERTPVKTIHPSGVEGVGRFTVLQWKARLFASILTLSLVAAALVAGSAKFIIYLDW
jgi:hypothetical protein